MQVFVDKKSLFTTVKRRFKIWFVKAVMTKSWTRMVQKHLRRMFFLENPLNTTCITGRPTEKRTVKNTGEGLSTG